MTQETLPTDPFDKSLSRLIGLPNGAHTPASVVQDVDFYGNTTSYMVQTVKHDEGSTTFVTQVNAQGSQRYILPPKVLQLIDRQRDSNTLQVRRRHAIPLVANLILREDERRIVAVNRGPLRSTRFLIRLGQSLDLRPYNLIRIRTTAW